MAAPIVSTEAPIAAHKEETFPALSMVDPARARRRWMAIGAFAVLAYSAAVLIVAALSADLGFYSHQGAAILAVESGSPAAEAGLQAGDRIVSINGAAAPTRFAVHEAVQNIVPGSHVFMTVERGSEVIHASFAVGRHMPFGSAAGILIGTVMLIMGLLADRGGPGVIPRAFFRSTLVYVVFLAGTFSWESVVNTPLLMVPWFFSMVLAAPATCHFMLKFPAGDAHQTRKQHLWLYGPSVLLGVVLSGLALMFQMGIAVPWADALNLTNGALAGVLAAVYLTVGAVSRARRLRRKRDEVDPIAARWIHLAGVLVATPLLAAVAFALIDVRAFVGGGFKPFVAVAMIGGSACVVLAMSRAPIGELDRMWRRSSGHLIATALAGGVFLAFIGIAGSTVTVLSGGSFQTALAATLVAAILFGPVRARIQRTVDERFARDRSRVRALLRDAAESAAATLDLDELVTGVVKRVQSALQADGAAIYMADGAARGGWRRLAVAGQVPIGETLDNGDPIARRLDASLTTRLPRDLAAGILGVPLAVDKEPVALVLAPRNARRSLDDEERELMQTIAAQLVVAIDNARAHTELRDVNEKLRREYELAEKRRRQIARLKERVEEENRALLGQLASRDGRQPVIGAGLKPTFELVQKVARTDTTALVRGETGVGKELIARAIHAGSSRRAGPFVVVDCGAISPGVFESALFGHERGAFTGAVKSQPGAFRSADGGTIFLDEIGELPIDLQPKLLRVLQERVVTPVGSDTPVAVDVRVVAGTNRNLNAEVDAGNFRQDLLYRLQVVEIEVPPLRERPDDIPVLAETFLEDIAHRTGRPQKRLADDALAALLDHTWPGNVRELEHTLEAAIVYAEGEVIRPSDLPIFEQVFRRRGERAISEHGTGNTSTSRGGLRETLEDLERKRLIEALHEHGGNRTRTAKALGMSRGALLRRMKRYDIDEGLRSYPPTN